MYLNLSFNFDYFPLLVVSAIAWGTPLLLSVLRLSKIPSVIIEIMLGYVIGHYVLDGIDHESFRILEFFALTGFIFLMFLSGLEIDVDQIIASFPRKKLTYIRFIKNPLLVGVLYFVLSLVIAYTGAWLLSGFFKIPDVWYFSLIMVTTSVGIVLPVLKDNGEIRNKYGQMIVVAAAVADIFSIVLFTFTTAIIKNGFQAELLYIFFLFLVFILAYYLAGKLKNFPFFKKQAFKLSHASSQIRIRGTVLLIMLFVVLAQVIGEEAVLLGSFLIGLVLSTMLHNERSVMLLKLDGMGYGFFIPIFFIMVGVSFDPSAFKEFDESLSWFLIVLLLLLFMVKFLPALLWQKLFGWRRALAGGFLMSSRLSLIIAASAIGLELGIITAGINASIVIMAIITCFASPVLYNWILPSGKQVGQKTVIVGGSKIGVVLAKRLNMHGKKSIIIEKNSERAKELADNGLNCIEGDGSKLDIYSKIGLNSSDVVVVNTGSSRKNLTISKLLRNDLLHEHIISKSNKSATRSIMKGLGVDTVDETGVMATTIENLILRPNTYHALLESLESFSVEEILLKSNNLSESNFDEIPFHPEAIVLLIKRGNTFFIPNRETQLQQGDVLHVFGSDTALEDTRVKMS